MLEEYNPELLVVQGNVAKYPLFFKEGSKLAFWAYFPEELIKEIHQVSVNYSTINKKIKYGKVSPSTIRKWFSNFLAREDVPSHVIRYIQGRSPKTTLEKHYFDLEVQADRKYLMVVEKIRWLLR